MNELTLISQIVQSYTELKALAGEPLFYVVSQDIADFADYLHSIDAEPSDESLSHSTTPTWQRFVDGSDSWR